MASIGSTSSESITTLAGLINPKTQREETDATPDTESTIVLRTGTRKFKIANRGGYPVKLSYTLGESATEYFTLYPHAPHANENVGVPTLTLYVQSPGASQPLEIESWL